FINRVKNRIFDEFLNERDTLSYITNEKILRHVAAGLGEEYRKRNMFSTYIEGGIQVAGDVLHSDDFYKCLRTLELIYESLSEKQKRQTLNERVNLILKACEVDLGIAWEEGTFIRTGAKLLDKVLVNESLRWLSNPKFQNVYQPFEKGLKHFIESEKRPELLSDVITDMYESLESLAKTVTSKPTKDLSANAELFVQKLRVSESYKRLLKDYILYANEFRHGKEEGKPRLRPTTHEVESFIYLTGLFIRLVINVEGSALNNAT
ncbi:MAG: hypothetical protein HGA87_05015, partial [Desulfobulbaceae bacterium]|nr:hypothetical protein [Desulfobulbaceae bacterium]